MNASLKKIDLCTFLIIMALFPAVNSVKIIVYNSLLTLDGDLLLAGGWVTEEVDLDTDFSDGLFL